uniref:E3 ubiquitin-protein ligase HECW1/2 N-terminal domain-containing protein n=1 Tax=Acanthochromis polyacanthus TaxID=80966 RepID=A0A3Q1FHE9_9TELE
VPESDTDLVSPDARSTLTISSSHYTIGQSEDLVITWDIKEEVDAGDWIGMYLVDEALSENFLDYKNRGINGSHRGQIVWKIDSSSNFSDSETQVCFRYYHGVTGALRATTPSVTIKKGTAPVSLTAPHAFIYTYEGFWIFKGRSRKHWVKLLELYTAEEAEGGGKVIKRGDGLSGQTWKEIHLHGLEFMVAVRNCQMLQTEEIQSLPVHVCDGRHVSPAGTAVSQSP